MRKLLIIIGIILLVLACAGLIFLNTVLDSFAEGGFILPQDCNGTDIHLSVTVHGVSSAQIAVTAGDFLQGEKGTEHSLWMTDAQGKFDSGTSTFPVFICEPFDVTISAKGYETQRIIYWVNEHFSEAELGASMGTGNILPVVLDIELQRSEHPE